MYPDRCQILEGALTRYWGVGQHPGNAGEAEQRVLPGLLGGGGLSSPGEAELRHGAAGCSCPAPPACVSGAAPCVPKSESGPEQIPPPHTVSDCGAAAGGRAGPERVEVGVGQEKTVPHRVGDR